MVTNQACNLINMTVCCCDFKYTYLYLEHSIHTFVQDGWTALHLTSQDGHPNVVRVLIEANARVNQRSKVTECMQVFANYYV